MLFVKHLYFLKKVAFQWNFYFFIKNRQTAIFAQKGNLAKGMNPCTMHPVGRRWMITTKVNASTKYYSHTNMFGHNKTSYYIEAQLNKTREWQQHYTPMQLMSLCTRKETGRRKELNLWFLSERVFMSTHNLCCNASVDANCCCCISPNRAYHTTCQFLLWIDLDDEEKLVARIVIL